MAKSKKKDDKIEFKGIDAIPPMPASLGSMRMNKTASWRSIRPIIDESKCTRCMLCWKFCPEPAIFPHDPPEIDYDFCKGCGICINICPSDAIHSEKEGK